MKKVISLCLSLAIIFSLTMPVAATEGRIYNEVADNGIVFEDSLGNEYILSSTVDGDIVTSVQTTLDGVLVAKTVLNTQSGELTNTVRAEQPESFELTGLISENKYYEYKSNLSNYIVSEDTTSQNNAARSSGFDSSFYDRTWVDKGTGRTDFIYQGKILTGDYSYRAMGTYTESNRLSFTFVRGTLITIISSALTQVLTGKGLITGAVLAINLLRDYGISTAEDAILGAFNPIVSIRTYDMKYRTVMYPNGKEVEMCIIDRFIDYVYSDLDGKINREYVDMISYTTGEEAIRGGCSESLGYAGYAFEAKYITQNRPDLKLPVSGNQWTWEDE